jgi:hypothetical protein
MVILKITVDDLRINIKSVIQAFPLYAMGILKFRHLFVRSYPKLSGIFGGVMRRIRGELIGWLGTS